MRARVERLGPEPSLAGLLALARELGPARHVELMEAVAEVAGNQLATRLASALHLGGDEARAAVADDGTVPVDDGTVSDEPAARDDGTVSDEPAALDDGTVSDEPAALDDGTVSDEPAALDDGTVSDEPAARDDGTVPVDDRPVSGQLPALDELAATKAEVPPPVGGFANEEAYNRAHPANVAEFNQLTHFVCADVTGTWVVFAKVRAWQAARGLLPDARIGPATLQAARSAPPGPSPEPIPPPAPPPPEPVPDLRDKFVRVKWILEMLSADLYTTHGTIRRDAAQRMELWQSYKDELEQLREDFIKALPRAARTPLLGPVVPPGTPEEKLAVAVLPHIHLPNSLRVVVQDPPSIRFTAKISSPAHGTDEIMHAYHAVMRDRRQGVDAGPVLAVGSGGEPPKENG